MVKMLKYGTYNIRVPSGVNLSRRGELDLGNVSVAEHGRDKCGESEETEREHGDGDEIEYRKIVSLLAEEMYFIYL
jgi:hypothetical protein